MIENKIINITKNNIFENYWTLFTPFNSVNAVNYSFQQLDFVDLVSSITFSNNVNIILSEVCIPSVIVAELKWVNKYITLNIIVKNEGLLKSYSDLHFNKVEVDETVNFSYIGVVGRNNIKVVLDTDIIQVDDTIDNVYFNNKQVSASYEFFKSNKSVFFMDKNGDSDYTKLISEAKKQCCEQIYYVVSEKAFSKQILDWTKEMGVTLLVSDYVGSGVFLNNGYNALFSLRVLKNDIYATYPIKDTFSCFGKLFKSCYLNDKVLSADLVGNYYVCINGKIQKLNIGDSHQIKISQVIPTMDDFVNNVFDATICNKHNEYSAVAKRVEYQFTLIPPIKDDTYKLSCIYEPILSLAKEIKKVYKINFVNAIDEIREFSEQDGLSFVFAEINDWYKWLVKAVDEYTYKRYYSKNSQFLNLLQDTQLRLLSYCEQMFSEINTENSDTKFDKFDDEIAGYQRQVVEKKALIEQGIDVLKNTSRVKTLEKKISDLLGLKKRFEGNASNHGNKELQAFLQKCNDILAGQYKNSVSEDSIGQVIEKTEQTKIMMLNEFVVKYLYKIKEFLNKTVLIVERLLKVEIPEDYKVFEKEGQQYIVIEDLKEYDETKHIQEKFKIRCLARR